MNIDHLLHPNNCKSECIICLKLKDNEVQIVNLNNKLIKGEIKMSKGIFWVVKNVNGKLVADEVYDVYNTRSDIRDNVTLMKGEKFVKVKLVEIAEGK